MKTINFSADGMKQAVPSFGTPDIVVFDMIAPFFTSALTTVKEWLGEIEVAPTIAAQVERLCYIMGCRRAVPQLDLVLTGHGFGVVSNQNHAPASAHRVEALLEELRRDESRTRDALMVALLATPWAMTSAARVLVNSLLWNPTLLRLQGVNHNGTEVFDREYNDLRPLIIDAQRAASRIISSALMAELIRRQRLHTERDYDLYEELREEATQFMAAKIMQRQGQEVVDMAEAERSLLHFVRTNKEHLPEYADSSTCDAHEYEPYRNEKDHGTFFFG